MTPARLMVAASGHDADMLYATRFYADDPFIWWEARGKSYIALSPLEIDRAKPVARAHGCTHSRNFCRRRQRSSAADVVILGIAAKYKIKSFVVPAQLSLRGYLEKLRAQEAQGDGLGPNLFPATLAQDERGSRSKLTAALACRGKGTAARH